MHAGILSRPRSAGRVQTQWYDRAVKATIERERKLTAAPGFRLPDDLPGEALPERELHSTYHDTSDHRLAAAAITLRYRSEPGRAPGS